MKIRIQLLLLISVFALTTVSCKKKNNPDPTPDGEVTNKDINTWVTDSMRYYYYWSASMPANSSLDMNKSPEAFFESILKRPDDRFSWIQNNEDLRNQLSGVIKTSGLGLSYFMIGTSNAGAAVRFVHKGSPAALAGIKRGDTFVAVNGSMFTVSDGRVTNAGPLSGNDPFTLTKGVWSEDMKTISPGGQVTLTPVEGFQEKAIHLDTVLTTPNGTKVAYLFYNRFLANQAQDLINAFSKFKAAGVTELIIDERYNSGGSVGVAGILAALVHKNFNINNTFIRYKWNSRFGEDAYTYGQIFGTANAGIVSANNLSLERVFILATGSSASASELLINNLIPFMGTENVIHIGKKTVGKDDASITISSSSPRFEGKNDWGIQPIVLKYTNRDGGGGFVNGLVPKYDVTEYVPYAPMGSAEDPLIGKALSIIDPSISAVYGRMMSINRERAVLFNQEKLEDFNRSLSDIRPLDVTETLKGKGLKLQ